MERRFKQGKQILILSGIILAGVLPSRNFLLYADDAEKSQRKVINENTSDTLEMIAERMKALSGSLASIPDPPQLNQVIQIPNGLAPEETSENQNTQKETEK